MANPLEKEFQYYLKHQDELVAKYRGRVIVIKDSKVIGDYDNEAVAVQETQKSHALGTFLIQRCEPGSANYTRTFHSRVSFA
jgi:hypothetical protein